MTDPTITIGRDKENSVLLNDDEVSRLHCSLLVESSRIVLVDEGSSNGTFLNGSAISRAEVQEGDKIRVGTTQFEINSSLQISLDDDSSPLTAAPTRVNKYSHNQAETETASTGFKFDRDEDCPFTEHRINNVLQGLTGGAHLVQAGLNSEDFELCKKGWEISRGNQIKVTELVKDLLVLNSQPALEPKRCDLAELIANAADAVKPKLNDAELVCQFPPVGETFASVDYGSMQTCLRYLLRLVIDAARGNGSLVEFSILRDHQKFHLVIRHPGDPIQIPPATGVDAQADYCGIAPKIVRKIVAVHCGKLTFRAATPGDGEAKSGTDSVSQSEAVLSFPLESA